MGEFHFSMGEGDMACGRGSGADVRREDPEWVDARGHVIGRDIGVLAVPYLTSSLPVSIHHIYHLDRDWDLDAMPFPIWPFFTLIPTFILIHLFVSPYTKVEESFNIQAIHDILVHGIPTENADQFLTANYDHVSFPGSVPRTFAGALVLSGLSRPFLWMVGRMEQVQLLGMWIIMKFLGEF